jgi:copper resistance protein C
MRFTNRYSIVVATLALLAPVTAFAHAHPVVMKPAPDSTVSAPAQVSIEFSEALEPKLSSLSLTDENGSAASKSTATLDSADAKRMILDLSALAPGLYIVHWVSVATDGHRLSGSYKFTVK